MTLRRTKHESTFVKDNRSACMLLKTSNLNFIRTASSFAKRKIFVKRKSCHFLRETSLRTNTIHEILHTVKFPKYAPGLIFFKGRF